MGIKEQVGIVFWGVRGSTPCANKENMEYGGNTTCLQVDVPGSGELLILDSGTGIRNLGNKIAPNSEEVSGRIFITHPHWDHIQGFPFFKPIYGSRNHFEIHMPEQVNGGCKEILSGHLTETFFPVTLDMIDANLEYITQPKGKISFADYEVESMLANHTVNTAIYKVYVDGKEIVFAPDNELNPDSDQADPEFYNNLKAFIEGVDVLVHDAQYNKKTYQNKEGWGHSPWEKVVDFAARADVKNLFLTHHDPDSNDDMLLALDQYVQYKFADDFVSIQLAKEGDSFYF